MVVELAEDDESLGSELTSSTAVPADSLHIVGLLSDCCNDDSAYRRLLYEAEEFSDSGSTGLRSEYSINGLLRELEEKILRKASVAVQE